MLKLTVEIVQIAVSLCSVTTNELDYIQSESSLSTHLHNVSCIYFETKDLVTLIVHVFKAFK
jgi:hypothetical protein